MKKTPIIILHGWNLSGDKFLPLVNLLQKKNFNVYAPDFPGFGKNPFLPRPYKLDDYVCFLKQFIKGKKFNEVILICHSFGGRVGIKYASQNPKKIKFLVLTGVPGYVNENQVKIFLFLIISKTGALFFRLPVLNHFAGVFRILIYRLAGTKDYYKTSGHLRETFKNVIRENLEKSMKALVSQTLLVWGEYDNTVKLKIAHKMNKSIKNSILMVIKEENHRLPYSAPEKFYNALSKYIDCG